MPQTAVATGNQAQANAWDGPDGAYWAAHHRRFDAVLSGYQPDFEDAAAVRREDDVLDIGCGTGSTTLAAARAAVDGSALGVDLSSRMLAVARTLAAEQGVSNVAFERGDAQVHPFPASGFDVAISRTGAMFFADPGRAMRNVGRSLRPGGRLTLLTWQAPGRNPWSAALARALLGQAPTPPPGAPGPFSMSDPATVTDLLTGSGYRDVELAGLSRPLVYGQTVDDAHGFLLGLLGWMLERRRPEERPAAEEQLRLTLAEHAGPDGVRFDSAMWLVTACRP